MFFLFFIIETIPLNPIAASMRNTSGHCANADMLRIAGNNNVRPDVPLFKIKAVLLNLGHVIFCV
jgi:hypothetical protein